MGVLELSVGPGTAQLTFAYDLLVSASTTIFEGHWIFGVWMSTKVDENV